MAFIPCDKTVSIGLEMGMNTRPCSCVLYAQRNAIVTVTSMQVLAQAIIDAIYAISLGAHIPANINTTLDSMRMTDLTTASSPAITWTHGTTADLPYTGATAGDVQGGQVASVVTWQTANRGRSYRGRSFFPGVPVAEMLDETTIRPTWVAGMATFWEAIRNAIYAADSGSFKQVVVSRHSGGAPRVAGVMTEVVTFRMNSEVGTQRRRVKP